MSRQWTQAVATVPCVGVSSLPKLACPACWPAYAGLLSSVGLGFFVGTAYGLPLTVAFLLLALAVMVFRARGRDSYGPLLLGLTVLGKFVWNSSPVLYGAAILLIAASIWNTYPQRSASCPACESSASVKNGNQN